MSNFDDTYNINLDHVTEIKEYKDHIDVFFVDGHKTVISKEGINLYRSLSGLILKNCIKQVIPFDGYVAYMDDRKVGYSQIHFVGLTASNELVPINNEDAFIGADSSDNIVGIYKTVDEIKNYFPETDFEVVNYDD